MLEQIPDYSQTPSKHPPPVADLAAVRFYSSSILYLAQLAVYAAMLIFSLLALLPFFFTAWYWLGLWLAFCCALAVASKRAAREKNAPAKQLQVIQQQWRLTTCAGSFAVQPGGQLLLWSWLIIIPLRELLTGRSHYLIALPDSLDKDAWRRLSTWINLCFTGL